MPISCEDFKKSFQEVSNEIWVKHPNDVPDDWPKDSRRCSSRVGRLVRCLWYERRIQVVEKQTPIDRGPMGMYFQWVRRFGTQNRAQNRVQNRAQNRGQNRVQNKKIDIQSWVLIRPFSTRFGPRMAGKLQSVQRKKLIFSTF